MPRGGRRNGAAGTAYAQRTDLNAPKPLAPTAAPGQPYGAAGAQLSAQAAVPMGPPPVLGGPSPGPAPTAPGPVPGAVPFHRPTERPSEPVTSGLPLGPGPGPSSPFGAQTMPGSLAGLSAQLAANPNAPDIVRQMASFAKGGRA